MDHRWWRDNLLLFDNCFYVSKLLFTALWGKWQTKNDCVFFFLCFSLAAKLLVSLYPASYLKYKIVNLLHMLAWWNPLLGGFEDALLAQTLSLLSWSFSMSQCYVITRRSVSPSLASHKMFLIRDANEGFAFENCQGNVWRCENSHEVGPDHPFPVSRQTSLL